MWGSERRRTEERSKRRRSWASSRVVPWCAHWQDISRMYDTIPPFHLHAQGFPHGRRFRGLSLFAVIILYYHRGPAPLLYWYLLHVFIP